MEPTAALEQVRQQIRAQIVGGKYRSLIDQFLSWIDRLFRRNPAKPFVVELGALILVCLEIVWGALILFLAEAPSLGYADFIILLPLMAILYIGVVGTRKYLQMFYSTISNHLLKAISSPENLYDIETWLASHSNKRLELIWSIFFAIAFQAYFVLTAILLSNIYPRLPVSIAYFPMFVLIGMLFYDFFKMIALPLRIQSYSYNLFPSDPASSEIITHLGNLFARLLFFIAATAGILTLLLAIMRPLLVSGTVLVIVIAWVPLFLAFTISQNALRNIIMNGKQKALNDIQVQIEKLQTRDEIPSEETLKHIRALIDYHDYIKSRRNSTLDVQAGLNFLNSLLFPVIGFLLGNLQELIALFTK